MMGIGDTFSPSAAIGKFNGLRRELYSAGYYNTAEKNPTYHSCEDCRCAFWGERSSSVHGHSACHAPSVYPDPLPGDPLKGDNNFPTKEKSWVIYECPKGSNKWFRHGWKGNVLYPREPFVL